MNLVRERAGDTLLGAVNGVNTTYIVTLDYDANRVAVYRNGLLLDPGRDNGYTLSPPRTVAMKEAPLDGDTIEVEYFLAPYLRAGGGAEGGIPDAPTLFVLAPSTYTVDEEIPELEADNLEPSISSGEDRPALSSDDLRPVIVPVNENGGC